MKDYDENNNNNPQRIVRRSKSGDGKGTSDNELLFGMRNTTTTKSNSKTIIRCESSSALCTTTTTTTTERTIKKTNSKQTLLLINRSHSLDDKDIVHQRDRRLSSSSAIIITSPTYSTISTSQSSPLSLSKLFHIFILFGSIFVLLLGWRWLYHINIILTSQYSTSTLIATSSSSQSLKQPKDYHFCRVPIVNIVTNTTTSTTKSATKSTTTTRRNNNKVGLLYQCSGLPYDTFAKELYSYVRSKNNKNNNNNNISSSSSLFNSDQSLSSSLWWWWGKRKFPIPSNKSILLLGNSHLRQVSKTILCQYSSQINYFQQMQGDSFIIRFTNNSTLISITNTVLVYSTNWLSWIEDEFLLQQQQQQQDENKNENDDENISPTSSSLTIEEMDALIFGKFTSYKEALNTNFEHMMKNEEEYYKKKRGVSGGGKSSGGGGGGGSSSYNDNNNSTSTSNDVDSLSFEKFPPPTLTDAAKHFRNPIISVSMFSITDISRFQSSRNDYYDYYSKKKKHPNPNNLTTTTDDNNDNDNDNDVYFINSRQYIDEIGLECGSDDKLIVGTCHEPGDIIKNSNRNPANMHRCAGKYGGHADLIAWDVIETLYQVLI